MANTTPIKLTFDKASFKNIDEVIWNLRKSFTVEIGRPPVLILCSLSAFDIYQNYKRDNYSYNGNPNAIYRFGPLKIIPDYSLDSDIIQLEIY